MNRRNFLQAMLAACAAPAIVKAENIMRVRPVSEYGILAPSGEIYLGTGQLYIGDQSLGEVYGFTIDCNGRNPNEVYEWVKHVTRSS